MGRFLRRPSSAETEQASRPIVLSEAAVQRDDGRGLLLGCGRLIMITLQVGLALAIVGLIILVAGYLRLNSELSGAIEEVVRYQGQGPGGVPRFFDRHGTLLVELDTAEKRRWLDYDEIPQDVINATIAVEDDTFWSNRGFDPEAILAALVSNYRNPDERPVGASTITQQLVRHIAFSYEERIAVSYDRKLREVFLAFILSQRWSKQEILQMYLNEIYYGNLAYGIEAAAQVYFAKPSSELSLAESAFLASLPQSPAELDPFTRFDTVKTRQEFILNLMVEDGLVGAAEAQEASQEAIRLAPLLPSGGGASASSLEAPHFVIWVQKQLEQRYGADALVKGGWQITTSLDLNLQKFTEEQAREWVAARAPAHDVNNAAVVIMKPGNGEVLAMVGSLDYFDESIDGQVNVALMPRQPGSSIKPITYAAAMERGWGTGDVIWDVPIVLDLGGGQKMIPINYDRRYHGPVLLRDALANSYNIPPIQLIRDIGVPAFISTGRKMGIESLKEPPGYYGLALTLGGGEVPLLEMTQAYATLANMGQRPRVNGVLQIVDSRGELIFDHQRKQFPPVNALDPRIAYLLTDILDDDVARAPAMGRYNALSLPFPVAAKTGTTNDFRDNWTLGYTPGVVVGVWVGNTDGHAMRNSSGLRGAAPLWRAIIEEIYAREDFLTDLMVRGVEPPTEFTKPSGIEERRVCLPRGTGGSVCSAWRAELVRTNRPVHGLQRLAYLPDTITNPGAWTLVTSTAPALAVQDSEQSSGSVVCVVNYSRRPAGAAVRLFLPIPPYYPDELVARRWANQYGYAMAPASACPVSGSRLVSGQTGHDGEPGSGPPVPANTTWRIDSPGPGQLVTGVIPIIGTASFDPELVQYYKLEIGQGVSPTSWSTFGTTHSQSVINGQLETLHASALPPGEYVIRLVVVQNDGNFPAPYSVPIIVGS